MPVQPPRLLPFIIVGCLAALGAARCGAARSKSLHAKGTAAYLATNGLVVYDVRSKSSMPVAGGHIPMAFELDHAGKRVAFLEAGQGVFVASAPRWKLRRLYKLAPRSSFAGGWGFSRSLRWSPDDRRLVIHRKGDYFSREPGEIILLDVKSGRVDRRIPLPRNTDAFEMEWLTSATLMFTAQNGSWTIDVNEGLPSRITGVLGDGRYSMTPHPSPDGERIIYERNANYAEFKDKSRLVLVDVEKGELKSADSPCAGEIELSWIKRGIVGLCLDRKHKRIRTFSLDDDLHAHDEFDVATGAKLSWRAAEGTPAIGRWSGGWLVRLGTSELIVSHDGASRLVRDVPANSNPPPGRLSGISN